MPTGSTVIKRQQLTIVPSSAYLTTNPSLFFFDTVFSLRDGGDGRVGLRLNIVTLLLMKCCLIRLRVFGLVLDVLEAGHT